MNATSTTECHPWAPFIPPQAKILIMGTFPPKPNRWSMDFYYPNFINDFWRIMGLIFHDDRNYFCLPDKKEFNLPAIKAMLTDRGIALNDTGAEVRRLKDNASDKFLEIIKPVNFEALLEQMPLCHTVATTGEKAASIISELTGTPIPRMGEMTCNTDGLNIWRMPSTSRAYPLRLEKKAEYYARMLHQAGII